ncbi:putative exported protein [Roseibium sp. TrichSKD4]|uniref:imelysin family protein n=1 Tax=Roseibium sp. TrichSKD4 TaxID=744980 RepID=UPI0001E5689A|nr:imelysin family protein [Roseibium sp. TrichSKD4]EFO32433.1 putative exported protein [Roseibium sp. TrichSKD4]
MRRLLIVSLAVLAIGPANAETTNFLPHVQKSVEKYVRPAMANFNETAEELPSAVATVCSDPTPEKLTEFSNKFSDVVSAFGAVSFLAYGPMLEDDRLKRLAFLPDPRGIAQRQINRFKASSDYQTITAAALTEKSVALQGLTALELIAFSKTTEPILGQGEHSEDCPYAQAIADNIANISRELVTSWSDPTGYTETLWAVGQNNPVHRTEQEAMETVFYALPTALTILKDQHVLPVIAKGKEKSRPRRLPFSRSANGIRFMTANMAGIRDALTAMDLEPSLPEDYKWLPGTAVFELNNAIDLAGKIGQPMRNHFKANNGFESFTTLALTLTSINLTVGEEIAAALNLSAGFNALDGD